MAKLKWYGSPFDYSNIVFKKRYSKYNDPNHPLMDATLARWDDGHTTIFLGSFRKCYGNKNSKAIQQKMMQTFYHESLHGVINWILRDDRWSGDLSPHWPFIHGLDDNYKRYVKAVTEREHTH